MFKTIYGASYKYFFVDYQTDEVYHSKYKLNIVCGWFLIVSTDGGETWEECKHVKDQDYKNSTLQYCIDRIKEVERAEEVK